MSGLLILQKFKFRDLVAQYGASIAVAAISFILTAAVARRIGAEQFGLYSTALAIGAMLGIFLNFGFKQIVQRDAARPALPFSYRELRETAIKNIVAVALLFVAGRTLLFSPHLFLSR